MEMRAPGKSPEAGRDACGWGPERGAMDWSTWVMGALEEKDRGEVEARSYREDLFLNFPSALLMSMPCCFRASLVAQNLPAMQKTEVWSLGREDPLEKGMVTHSSILSWRIPRTGEPGRLQSMGSQRVRYDWATNTFTFPLVATFAENDSQFHVWLR